MNFPTLVYRTPGPHHAPTGTYDYRSAATPEELEEAKSYGWFLTIQEAINGEALPVVEEDLESPAAPPASSDEIIIKWLSEKLTEHGVAHDEFMTADELLFLICAGYAGQLEGQGLPEEQLNDDLNLEIDDTKIAADDDNAQPTREELEAKAAELEIKFDGRTTDKSLAEKIEFVLAEREQ